MNVRLFHFQDEKEIKISALPSSYISLLLKSVSNSLPAGNTNFPSMFQSYSKACIEYFTSCSGSLLLLFKITNYDAYVGILHMQTCQAFIEKKMRKIENHHLVNTMNYFRQEL